MSVSPPSSPPSGVPPLRPQPRASLLRSTLFVAILLATLFTAWSPSDLSLRDLRDQMTRWLTPRPLAPAPVITTPLPPLRIGIVAGHLGSDPGAVCVDENGQVTLTEQEVNLKIATLVQQALQTLGYQVELLQEFDTRLAGFRGAVLVSIHNDSCEYINDQATGFKVAAARDTRDLNRAERLTACLVDRYLRVTGLKYHPGSITPDMTDYHTFSEIDPNTVAAIIETGFLYLDREFLTRQTDRVAEGIVQGILCFINNESIEPTPFPK